MANADIKGYISKQKSFGTSDEIIREKLSSVGWIDDDINNAFIEVQKEQRISEITSGQKDVPTSNTSGYTKDPYREPVGQGEPKANAFLKKEESKKPEVNRDWGTPGGPSVKKEKPAPREGQRFAPNYKAVPMDPDEGKNLLPDLNKAGSTYVGTSFVPKKDNSGEKALNQNTQSVPIKTGNEINAFKVMPRDIAMVSGRNMSQGDSMKIKQAPEFKKKSHFWGRLLFIIVFLSVLAGAIIVAEVSGYIKLPVEIPFIESLKQNNQAVVDDTEVFVPEIPDEIKGDLNQNNKPEEENLPINNQTENESEEIPKEVELEVKQEINLLDDQEEAEDLPEDSNNQASQ